MASLGYRLDWHHPDDADPGLKWKRYAYTDTGDVITSIALPSYNEWHHIVVVTTGERHIVYVDGTLKDDSEFTPTSYVNDTSTIQLGASGDGDLTAQSGNVTFAEHSIVPYDLTAEEVGDLYAAAQGIYPTGNSFPSLVRDQLVAKAYYRMTERWGDIATDDMASLNGVYTGDLSLATTVSAMRGGGQPAVTLHRSEGTPGHILVGDTSKMDFFDSTGDFSVVLFYRRDREFRFGPMPMQHDFLSTGGTSLSFDLPDGNDETPKAKPGDLWLIVASHEDATEDVGASLVTNGFTSLWNATQTNYRTFGVYKWVTQADIDARTSDVTTTSSVNISGDAWLIRSARSIEAVHNNAGNDPPSIDPTWSESEYLWRTYGGFGWGAGAPVSNYHDDGFDARTTSETFDPSSISMGSDTQTTSWTIAVRGFSEGAGDLGPASYIFQRHDGTDGHLIQYDPDNDQVVYSRDAGATVHSVTINEPALDEWHMLIATYDGTDMHLYLDGSLATAKTGSNPQASTLNVGVLSTPTYIGNTTTTPGLEFNVSDFAMFDYALTANEVSDMWEKARGGISGRGSLMLRWTSGSRSGWVMPFSLGDMDFGYELPFALVGTDNAKSTVMPFILNGPIATAPNGYRDLAYAMAPIGYWTLLEAEDQFLDSIGTVHGTATGTFRRNVFPALVNSPNNKMVEFNNSASAYIDLGDNHDFNVTAAFTWAGWVRDDGQDSTSSLVSKYDGTDGYRLRLLSGSTVSLTREDTSTSTTVTSTTALSGIHHVAGTYDGTTLRIYIDGIEEDSAASSESITAHTTSLTLGGATGESLNAAMDEWGVWDRALSADEVWTLSQARENPENADSGFHMPFSLEGPVFSQYELPFRLLDATVGTSSGFTLAPLVGWWDPTPATTLAYFEFARSQESAVAYWRFDEASGAVAYDHLGGVDLDYIGSPTLGVPGPIKGEPSTAVDLDGASQSIRYATTASGDYLHVGDTLTLIVWFQRAGVGAEELYCAGANGLEVGIDGSDQLYAAKQGVGNFFATTTTVADTDWHMLAVTKSGSERAMYLDGVALTNSASDQTLTDTTGDIYIGRHQPAASGYFEGTLGEVTLYGAALSASVIAELYARARG